MSIALWQEYSATFLVLVPRGKLLQHMGRRTEVLGFRCIWSHHEHEA